MLIQIPEEEFASFKEQVLSECADARGLDKSIFQDPRLLHLTVGTMALMGKFDRPINATLYYLETCTCGGDVVLASGVIEGTG